LHVFEPPSRQERQGKIFCFAGMPQSKNEAFHFAVIKTSRTSGRKRKASSLTKTEERFWSRQFFFCRCPAKEN
jgi:hypothetical protein